MKYNFLHNLYYIDKGKYKDCFILFLNIKNKKIVEALILPFLIPQKIKINKIIELIKKGILLYSESPSPNIIKACKKQYSLKIKKINK